MSPTMDERTGERNRERDPRAGQTEQREERHSREYGGLGSSMNKPRACRQTFQPTVLAAHRLTREAPGYPAFSASRMTCADSRKKERTLSRWPSKG
jgi:hypothetical protein